MSAWVVVFDVDKELAGGRTAQRGRPAIVVTDVHVIADDLVGEACRGVGHVAIVLARPADRTDIGGCRVRRTRAEQPGRSPTTMPPDTTAGPPRGRRRDASDRRVVGGGECTLRPTASQSWSSSGGVTATCRHASRPELVGHACPRRRPASVERRSRTHDLEHDARPTLKPTRRRAGPLVVVACWNGTRHDRRRAGRRLLW